MAMEGTARLSKPPKIPSSHTFDLIVVIGGRVPILDERMPPPSGAYNALCVLQSLYQILSHAAKHRAAQVEANAVTGAFAKTLFDTSAPGSDPKSRATENRRAHLKKLNREREAEDEEFKNILNTRWEDRNGRPREEGLYDFRVDVGREEDVGVSGLVQGNIRASEADPEVVEVQGEVQFRVQLRTPPPEEPPVITQDVNTTLESSPTSILGSTLPSTNAETAIHYHPPRNLQSSKVPSSRIGRLFHYGGLAASLSYGAAAELVRRSTGSDAANTSSLMLTDANIKRLVGKLSQMRGAALKLGQFMSIQDTHVLPPELDQIFRRVQDSAHYMPDWQMEASRQVLSESFGPDWCNLDEPHKTVFTSFERVPFAAASIGQVHRAVLAPRCLPPGIGDPERGLKVAVKVQFPNIANSIKSDLGYVKMILTAGRLLPKGLFLDRTIEVMSSELADECSYKREASFLRKFRKRLGADPRFKVPWVWEASSETVLVMERVEGVSLGDVSTSGELSREDRNNIAAWIIELCLKELFEFRMMQTDPNWTNFLWNSQTRQIELVDFGATREYTKEFMDDWVRLLQAAALSDKDACVEWSTKLGYLTGEENQTMIDAHIRSMVLLATPFRQDTPQPFGFGPSTPWAEITAEIRDLIPVMLRHRLTPPPQETYSLNRKLSGAFLLASRLGAEVDTRAIWERVM